MRVAVVQLRSGSDKGENLARFEAAVRGAAADGAELVVGPEAVLHEFGPPRFDLTGVAEPLDGPFVERLSKVAADAGVVVVAGMFEARPSSDRVHNTVVVVGPSGLMAAYRKLHLYDALGWRESARVAGGDPAEGPPVVDVGDVRMGVMTCYDLRFPEVVRTLVDQGATAVAVPSAWVAGPGKAEQWEVLARARAIESTVYVLAAGQPEPDYTGRSMVVDPAGVVVAALGAEPDGWPGGVLTAELSSRRTEEVRAGMPVLEHRRFAVRPAPAG